MQLGFHSPRCRSWCAGTHHTLLRSIYWVSALKSAASDAVSTAKPLQGFGTSNARRDRRESPPLRVGVALGRAAGRQLRTAGRPLTKTGWAGYGRSKVIGADVQIAPADNQLALCSVELGLNTAPVPNRNSHPAMGRLAGESGGAPIVIAFQPAPLSRRVPNSRLAAIRSRLPPLM
jgi:hypothetical protein